MFSTGQRYVASDSHAYIYISCLFIYLFIYLSAYQLTDSWHSIVGVLAGLRVGPSKNRSLFAEVERHIHASQNTRTDSGTHPVASAVGIGGEVART